ncbi:hypothetical protein [Actinoplanes philippinensis]|uniref:hypothetical protein n=1 Tax=Actinoplanes philippinensis TaxID=35752 RepID=UPI003403F8C1
MQGGLWRQRPLSGGRGARMTTASTVRTAEQLERTAETGMEQGVRPAMGQIGALLAEG